MLARVAHALFALAHDLERAEGLARLLETGHALALESHAADGRASEAVWEPLVAVAGDPEEFHRTHLRADARSVSWAFAFDIEDPTSIAAALTRARANAMSVRDTLPTEVWEAINGAAMEPGRWPPKRVAREGVYPFCRDIRRAGHQIAGVMDHAMRRDEAWEFMCLGRFLERADFTVRMVAVRYGSASASPDGGTWTMPVGHPVADEARLLIDGVGIAPETMSRLLMLDEGSPRSVAFGMLQLERAIMRLADMGSIAPDPPALTLARAARGMLAVGAGGSWAPADVDALGERMIARLGSIAQAIADSCFLAAHDASIGRHAQASRQAQN
ncbi:MAG: alpha-E domain-containing protein [Miltoncostaeaceae bacterium]